MEYIFKTIKEIDYTNLNYLTNSVGWGNRSEEKWKQILSKSTYIISAWDKNKLIGFGRIVEDGTMCMVYDIAVLPEFQSKGIGSELMKNIMKEIKKYSFDSVGLFAWDKNPQNIKFYNKFGFKQIGYGMKLKLE